MTFCDFSVVLRISAAFLISRFYKNQQYKLWSIAWRMVQAVEHFLCTKLSNFERFLSPSMRVNALSKLSIWFLTGEFDGFGISENFCSILNKSLFSVLRSFSISAPDAAYLSLFVLGSATNSAKTSFILEDCTSKSLISYSLSISSYFRFFKNETHLKSLVLETLSASKTSFLWKSFFLFFAALDFVHNIIMFIFINI